MPVFKEIFRSPTFQFHPHQRHPNFRPPNVQANCEVCEDRSLVSPSVMEGLRRIQVKQSSVSRIVICTVSFFARSRVCLQLTVNDLRPSQPRTLLMLIWDPKRAAVHRPVYSVSFCEHKRAIAVGSEQRTRSRHQARRGPLDCKKSRASRMREASSGTFSTSGEADTSGNDSPCG